MTSKINFCATFLTVINKSFNIKIVTPALKELANNDSNTKGSDNCSCSCLFCTIFKLFLQLTPASNQIIGSYYTE